jgi:hypothetical protein
MWMLILSAFLLGVIMGFIVGVLTTVRLCTKKIETGIYCTGNAVYECRKFEKGETQ